MSRKSKLYFIIVGIVTSLFLAGWVIKTYIVQPTFHKIEETRAIEQAARAQSILKSNAQQLNALLSDWAEWDAMYAFAKQPSKTFYQENLSNWNNIVKETRIDLFYVYSNTGKLQFGKAGEDNLSEPIVIPEFQSGTILEAPLTKELSTGKRWPNDMIATPNGLLIISAAKIVKTSGEGPYAGTLFFGRFITPMHVEQASEDLKIDVSILLAKYHQMTPEEKDIFQELERSNKQKIFLSNNLIVVYELITDLSGRKLGMIKTKVPTTVMKIAQEVMLKLFILLGILTLVFLMLFFVYTNRTLQKNEHGQHGLSLGVVAAISIGLFITFGLAFLIYQNKQKDATEKFQRMSIAQQTFIRQKLEQDVDELMEIRRFFEGSELVDRHEFKRFVLPYLNNRSFHAIEWIPKVNHANRKTLETLAREEGVSNFVFTELDAHGKKITAPERSVYYPVYYVEPQSFNKEAIGYAPTHLKMRDEAIQHSLRNNSAAVTSPFRLVQETGNQKGLMVFVPLIKSYTLRGGGQTAVIDTSFIACVYRVDDLLRSASMTGVSENLNVRLIDITSKNYFTLTTRDTSDFTSRKFLSSAEISFAGRQYRVDITANQSFFSSQDNYSYLYMLLGGLLVTALIALYFNELLTQKARADELVTSRTLELQESESRYQTFITQSTEGICRLELTEPIALHHTIDEVHNIFTRGTVLAECNMVFANQLGYSGPDEIVGRKVYELSALLSLFNSAFIAEFVSNQYRVTGYECINALPNGTEKIFLVNMSGIIEDNHLVRMWGNQSDITSKKESEKALKESEEHFRTLAENSPEIIMRIDKHLKFLYANNVVQKLLFVSPNNIIGAHLHALPINSELKQILEVSISHVFEFKELLRGEYLTTDDIWIDWLFFPEIDETGSVKEVIISARDITDIKLVEDELRREKDRAEESDRLKSAFLANMSHEIRTPMNAIMGFSELLDDEEISPDEKKYFIQKLRRRTTDLLNLINDILDISKIEAEQIQLFETEFNVKKVLTDMQDVFSGLQIVEKKDIKFTINCDIPDAMASIILDKNRLKQILINLINNSYKFTVTGEIILSCSIVQNRDIIFSVQDTGIGIEKEKKDSIFDRFRQGDDESFSKKFGGTGLGLAIVKGLIERMQGSISLESTLQNGTTVTVSFPYRPVEQKLHL